MTGLDGIGWKQERELEQAAGLDWLEDLREETQRLLDEEDRRYRHLPWPRPAMENDGRRDETFGADPLDEAA